MELLQLELAMVTWPEAGLLPSFRSAKMETPSTFNLKLPLALLKGDKQK